MHRAELKLSDKPSIPVMKRQAILRKTKTLINRLSDYRMIKGQQTQITEMEISNICLLLVEILSEEPSCLLLQLEYPLNIVGDIHGHYLELLQILAQLGYPPNTQYLFLGNYVGRGERSVETIVLLFALKLLYPEKIYLLRGNHECDQLGHVYGFYDECSARFSNRLWSLIMQTFNYLPVTAIIERSIFCSHSGFSPCILYSGCESITKLRDYINRWIPRPSEIESNLLLTHFVWSEPDLEVDSWARNPCGLGYLYGPKVIGEFCDKFHLSQVVRSNHMVYGGCECFEDSRLVTIFSAPGFMKTYKNDAAVLNLSRDDRIQSILCRIRTIRSALLNRGEVTRRKVAMKKEMPQNDGWNVRLSQEEETSD